MTEEQKEKMQRLKTIAAAVAQVLSEIERGEEPSKSTARKIDRGAPFCAALLDQLYDDPTEREWFTFENGYPFALNFEEVPGYLYDLRHELRTPARHQEAAESARWLVADYDFPER